MAYLKSIDFLIGLFGYSRVRYSQESHVLDAIMSALGRPRCGEMRRERASPARRGCAER